MPPPPLTPMSQAAEPAPGIQANASASNLVSERNMDEVSMVIVIVAAAIFAIASAVIAGLAVRKLLCLKSASMNDAWQPGFQPKPLKGSSTGSQRSPMYLHYSPKTTAQADLAHGHSRPQQDIELAHSRIPRLHGLQDENDTSSDEDASSNASSDASDEAERNGRANLIGDTSNFSRHASRPSIRRKGRKLRRAPPMMPSPLPPLPKGLPPIDESPVSTPKSHPQTPKSPSDVPPVMLLPIPTSPSLVLPSSTYEVIVIDDEDIVIESPTLILRAFEEDEPQDLSPKAPKPGSTHSGSSMWRV